jgi:DUF1009 family protein
MDVSGRRLGILAGGGTLPREIADSAARRGVPVQIVAIDGEADADFAPHPVTPVNWGQIGTMLEALRSARATDLVIVGRVHRPEIWGLKPDLGFFGNLPAIIKIVASGGDDSVLRRVVRFFERRGLHVVGPGEAAPELVIGEGPLGSIRSSAADASDIRKGLEVVRALGAFDVGQGVVVSGGIVEAIEGAEGTDRMLARTAQRRRASGRGEGRHGVFVKRSKPSQDLRVDMPAIGPETIASVCAAGLDGIAVEAGKVLVAGRDLTVQRADEATLFVEGVDDSRAGPTPPRFNAKRQPMAFRTLGQHRPQRHSERDAAKGLAAVAALAEFGAGRAAVVVRNHVLAVEAGEGVVETVRRAAGLRQWTSLTRRRRGVATLRTAGDLAADVVEAVANAGYAGIALVEGGSVRTEVLAEANRRGIFVMVRYEGALIRA